jgi:hypothetical protein
MRYCHMLRLNSVGMPVSHTTLTKAREKIGEVMSHLKSLFIIDGEVGHFTFVRTDLLS